MAQSNDPLSLYPEANAPLPLYRVLLEEYAAQRRGDAPPTERFALKLASLKTDYGLTGADGGTVKLGAEDRTRIEKKINSEMVKEFYRWLHEDRRRARTALCLSGGGIRSATFGLGVLQGLARHDLLQQFDYLSTVSGGGYLGGWLSAWIHRRGLAGVVKRLKNEPSRKSPLQPEAETIKHLRAYSNYMSPKVGLLSADTWTLVATYLRNLLLNWLVLVPLVLAALVLPRVYTWGIAIAQKPSSRGWATEHGATLFVFGVLCGIVAIAYTYLNRPSLGVGLPQSWRGQKWFLWACLLPFVSLSVCSTLAYSWYPAIPAPAWLPVWLQYKPDGTNLWAIFAAFGVVLQIGGFVLAMILLPFFKSPAGTPKREASRYALEFVVALVGGALSGLLTWLLATKIFAHGAVLGDQRAFTVVQTAYYSCFALPLFLLLVLIAVTIFIGLTSRLTTDADREWLARAGAWLLIVCFAWSLASIVVVFAPVLLLHPALGKLAYTELTSVGVLSGLVTLVFGRSSRSPANSKEAQQSSTTSALGNLALSLAAAVFAVFLLTLLSLLTVGIVREVVGHLTPAPSAGFFAWLSHTLIPHQPINWNDLPNASFDQRFGLLNVLYHTPGRVLLALIFVSVAVSVVMGLGININKFSLHAAYRDRLIRAYLGASRNERDRDPNPFTGFDEQDNLQMQELRTERFYADGIRDLRALAEKLVAAKSRKGDDDPAEFIYNRLCADVRRRLEEYLRPSQVFDPTRENDLKAALAAELNFIITDEELYEEDAFKSYWTNSDEIGRLVPHEGDDVGNVGVERLRANRRLVEMAFNDESNADTKLRATVFEPAGMCKPLHVVNIALNLVGGEDLAWQNRKAESFTISALHAGSYCVGYRDSRVYALDTERRAISLGTAVAVSGAAVSPNMGYHSSPLVTFLLTLFNVRLGWWLGNPGKAGKDTYNHAGPLLAFRPIISEALGLTNDRNKYVYISDGGHFENLGVYEMILRRCRFIVVSDGSEDHEYTFEGLGNAISKVRVDLGVPVNFEKISIFPKDYEPKSGETPGYCALGRICYSCVDEYTGAAEEIDGYLLYIKATLTGTEPKDIYNYSRAHGLFPHESTGDQMYSEEQFESYRELGSHAFKRICETYGVEDFENASPPAPLTVEQLFELIKARTGTLPHCD
ncbi:MAG: patatin-like phospholipase family protein [Pyrinomonadaceae bacterium]